MTETIKCPWCGKEATLKCKILQRQAAEVVERNCPRCGKVISAYLSGEKFLDLISEHVLTFND